MVTSIIGAQAVIASTSWFGQALALTHSAMRSAFGLVGDLAGRRRQVGRDLALEVERQVRVRLEVVEPGARGDRRAASR